MDNENYFKPETKIDDALQREIDEAFGDMNLADLLDAEDKKETGQRGTGVGVRKGKVIAIHGDDIFVDVGGRSEGLLPADQFRDEPLPVVGETIEVVIEKFDSNEGILRLSRDGAVQAASWETIEVGQIVEGRVTGHNKGGLELVVNGIDAFMPISQIDIARIEDLTPYTNEKLECLISEVDHREGNLIVSRRDLMKKRQGELADELWETLHEGKVLQGTVRTIMPYGAFVDIGGCDGLLHIRDMAHSRVEKPEDIVHVGQELEVKVLSIDKDEKRIGLGLKQTLADPWDGAEGRWGVGETFSGRITNLASFGAFVELEPGVEGLIPIGELSFRRIGHPKEVVNAGDVVKVRILNVDSEQQRMSLSIKQAGEDPWVGASVRWAAGSNVEGTVTRTTDFGAFVELAPGVEGLIHISQLSDKRIATVTSVVSVGQTVTARVVEVDEERRRIGLSMKPESSGSSEAASEGTLADLEAIQNKPERKRKKPLKGGIESGTAKTRFGDLNMG